MASALQGTFLTTSTLLTLRQECEYEKTRKTTVWSGQNVLGQGEGKKTPFFRLTDVSPANRSLQCSSGTRGLQVNLDSQAHPTLQGAQGDS